MKRAQSIIYPPESEPKAAESIIYPPESESKAAESINRPEPQQMDEPANKPRTLPSTGFMILNKERIHEIDTALNASGLPETVSLLVSAYAIPLPERIDETRLQSSLPIPHPPIDDNTWDWDPH